MTGVMTRDQMREWILRGLVMSCISSHHLHKWIVQNSNMVVPFYDFGIVLNEVRLEGLVYVQRDVTCYECYHYMGDYPIEPGYALTSKGEAVESAHRQER